MLTLSPLDLPYYDRWGQKTDSTFAQESERWGIPMSFIERMHDALGFPPPTSRSIRGPTSSTCWPTMSLALAARFDPDAQIGLMRVYADSLRRITRTETPAVARLRRRAGTEGGPHAT